MAGKLCLSCKKPMNGGVYRRPDLCPHCSASQASVAKQLASQDLKVKKQPKPEAVELAAVEEKRRAIAATQVKPNHPSKTVNENSTQNRRNAGEFANHSALPKMEVEEKTLEINKQSAKAKASRPTAVNSESASYPDAGVKKPKERAPTTARKKAEAKPQQMEKPKDIFSISSRKPLKDLYKESLDIELQIPAAEKRREQRPETA